MVHRIGAALIAMTASLVASDAFADEASTSFGRRGTVVLGDVAAARAMAATPIGFVGVVPSFSAGWLSFGSVEHDAMKIRYVRIDPTVDVFVAEGMSIGARLGGSYGWFEGGAPAGAKVWNATLVPRLGYSFDLSDEIAVWPRIAAGVTIFDEPNQTRTGTVFRSALDVPFVFRLSRHVVFDVGPEIAYVDHLSGPIDFKGVTGGGRGALSVVF